MKTLIALMISFFSLNLSAIEPDVFSQRYPTFQNFNQILFSDLRNYFEALPIHSLNYSDEDGARTYKVHNPAKNGFTTIYSKIIRSIHENEIKETVIYSIENGNSIQFEVLRKGEGIVPSRDIDLLTFSFKKGPNDKLYQLTLPNFNFQISYSKQGNNELALFNLGLMEVSVQIESLFHEAEASLNYIYFYKGMPTPQASLTVKAIETRSQWGSIQYVHISSQAAGEITPGQFFAGLNDGAGIFFGGGKMMFQMLTHLGFHKLD